MPGTTVRTEPENATGSSGWTRAEKVLTLVTAVVGLIAAVLGVVSIQASQAKTAAQETVVDQNSELGALQTQIANDRVAISSLQQSSADQAAQIQAKDAKIKKLEAQLPPEDVAAAADPATPAIRHQGEVTLADVGDAADLNASASDPQWGSGKVHSYSSDAISLNLGNLYFEDVEQIRLTASETADYKTCSTKTGYGSTYQTDVTTVSDTPNTCLRLNSGRFGTYRMVDRQPQAVTLELTIWETA